MPGPNIEGHAATLKPCLSLRTTRRSGEVFMLMLWIVGRAAKRSSLATRARWFPRKYGACSVKTPHSTLSQNSISQLEAPTFSWRGTGRLPLGPQAACSGACAPSACWEMPAALVHQLRPCHIQSSCLAASSCILPEIGMTIHFRYPVQAYATSMITFPYMPALASLGRSLGSQYGCWFTSFGLVTFK